MKECLKGGCGNLVSDYKDDKELWCSLKCKKGFLLDNYDVDETIVIMKANREEFKKNQEEVIAKIKESGLTVIEYFKTLNKFV